MRFQTNKVMQESPEVVLRALEGCLREMFADVVRDGSKIVFHGLGASPRIINRRDITIVEVEPGPSGSVITADVTFQVSCLLGESPQDLLVLSKLDCVFERMTSEICAKGLDKWLTPQPLFPTPILPAGDVPQSPPKPVSFTLSSPEVPPPAINWPRSECQPQKASFQTRVLKRTSIYLTSFWPRTTDSTLRMPFVALVGVALLALGVYTLRFVHGTNSLVSSNSHIQAAPTALPRPTVEIEPAAPDKSRTMFNANYQRSWIQKWVAAMRTRNPVLQGSFYANSVDNYFGERNVSRVAILEDRKTEIEHRPRLWTVRLEEVVGTREDPDGMTFRFIMHFIGQTVPGRVEERSVRVRLRVMRFQGSWQIVSEDYLH